MKEHAEGVSSPCNHLSPASRSLQLAALPFEGLWIVRYAATVGYAKGQGRIGVVVHHPATWRANLLLSEEKCLRLESRTKNLFHSDGGTRAEVSAKPWTSVFDYLQHREEICSTVLNAIIIKAIHSGNMHGRKI